MSRACLQGLALLATCDSGFGSLGGYFLSPKAPTTLAFNVLGVGVPAMARIADFPR